MPTIVPRVPIQGEVPEEIVDARLFENKLQRAAADGTFLALSATILVIAVGFAFSHAGRTGLSLCTTILTGIAFGWMRAQSESTAAAALMHAVYNLVLSYLATF
jgi:hypothetical protein